MAGDVDQLTFAGKKGARVPAGTLGQRVVIGADDDDDAQVQPGDLQTAQRLADAEALAVAPSLQCDQSLLLGDRGGIAPEPRGRRVSGEPQLEPGGEAVLLVGRVERRERVLPAPDKARPEKQRDPAADQE